MKLVFDTEASGLDTKRDRVWCLVAHDVDTGERYEFTPDNLEEIPGLLARADLIVGHNLSGYDLRILRSNGLLPEPCPAYRDTLVLSRLLYPDRDGGHSVENWAKILGCNPKQEHEDWSQFSPEMLERCRSDVDIQVRIWEALKKEAEGWDWSVASRIEHAIQEIIIEQEEYGWKFDVDGARGLVGWLEKETKDVEESIVPMLAQYPSKEGSEVKKPWRVDGEFTQQVQKWREEEDVCGPFCKVKWNTISLTQREKLAKELVRQGWAPTEYTETGIPKLTINKDPCPNLEGFGDLGKKFAYYQRCKKRYDIIKGWVEHVEERGDGRITPYASNITHTGRRRQRVVANVPKAEEGIFLGKEMRQLFTCDEGRVLVGCDAQGLEMRLLAHYMDDEEFTRELLEGDIHTVMWKASQGIIKSRSITKNCEYAMLYGAQDYRLGITAEYSPSEATKVGAEIRKLWGGRFPKLKELTEDVQKKARKRGWLKALDGRKLWMRADHKALNTLLQGGGACVMNVAMMYQEKWIKSKGLDSRQVVYYHDETARDTRPDQAEQVGQLMNKAIEQSGKFFKLRIPLEGEHKIGHSWADTH